MGRAARRKAGRSRRDSATPPAGDRKYTYCYYLTAYVDVLGQRDELKRLRGIHHDEEHREAAFAILRTTAGRVLTVRKAFKEYFDTAASNDFALRGLTAQQLETYRRMRRMTFHASHFSDTFVVSVPLWHNAEFGGGTAALNMWSALYGVAGMSLFAFGSGIPLRAGIAIERGIDIRPDEVYGLSLVDAYELERDVAQYPRAVLNQRVLMQIAGFQQDETPGVGGATARWVAEQCRRLICRAPDDQQPMVHPLSSVFREIDPRFDELASKSFSWAVSELRRFESLGAHKLIGYYTRLIQYFEQNGYRVTP
jgi:hypothetical protein